MSDFKKTIRKQFRLEVFERDSYKCRGCGKQGYDHNDPQEVAKQEASGAYLIELDAHHITSRDEMVAGGYVKENGVSLCPDCHMKAEVPHAANVEFLPESLYKSIGSSKNNAHMACLTLQARMDKFQSEKPEKRKVIIPKTKTVRPKAKIKKAVQKAKKK